MGSLAVNKKSLPEHETMVARILEVATKATKEDTLAGTEWYGEAEEVARDIAAGTEHTADTIAGVISAVSPRMPWGRNKVVAREIVARFEAGSEDFSGLGLNKNVALAVDILRGTAPASVLKNKRLAFYRNIAGDPNYVTVDVWATRVACGAEYDSPGNCYDEIAAAYAEAADVVKIAPRTLQAIVWVAYRRNAVTEKHLESLNRDSSILV